ncbi:hypothetical protein ABVK25_011703 [Lepraria finkii]|uniref:Uncharacterized protein n=1 Tax=Lepraria finkii TaxID=1340010 RepID=A0ABR4APJ6_9LECA
MHSSNIGTSFAFPASLVKLTTELVGPEPAPVTFALVFPTSGVEKPGCGFAGIQLASRPPGLITCV